MSVFKCEDCGDEKSANGHDQCARCLRDLCEDCMGDGECPNEGVSHVSMSGAKSKEAKRYRVTLNAMVPVTCEVEVSASSPQEATAKAIEQVGEDADGWTLDSGEPALGEVDPSTVVAHPEPEIVEDHDE